MADHRVGAEITSWLINNYRDDISLIVAIAPGDITAAASAAGIPHVIFETHDQLVAFIERSGVTFDLGVLAWWPKLIRHPLLDIPRHGFINTHPSLLPYNRGKHYNFWAIVEQAPFGVSLHMVSPEVDAGDIVAQREIRYGWEDTGQTLYQKAGDAMIALFRDSYPTIRTLTFARRPQPTDVGSFHRASELEPSSRIELDRLYTARALLNLLRARTFAGHPACSFTDDDGKSFEVRIEIKAKQA
jgi:methionyl-tRNA formyltransferase